MDTIHEGNSYVCTHLGCSHVQVKVIPQADGITYTVIVHAKFAPVPVADTTWDKDILPIGTPEQGRQAYVLIDNSNKGTLYCLPNRSQSGVRIELIGTATYELSMSTLPPVVDWLQGVIDPADVSLVEIAYRTKLDTYNAKAAVCSSVLHLSGIAVSASLQTHNLLRATGNLPGLNVRRNGLRREFVPPELLLLS